MPEPFVLSLLLAMFLVVALLSTLAERLHASTPVVMLIAGVVLALLPGVPAITLDPDLTLLALLPRIAAGEMIGCFALAEGNGNPSPNDIQARVTKGELTGVKWPVADGGIADLAVIAARDEADEIALYLVRTRAIDKTTLRTLDPTRDQARFDCDAVPAEKLPAATGWAAVQRLLDRAAILFAFEQVGGAEASLDMAKAYALERYAFGRPIGSFQAIKHKLADVYVALELARSNAYYGAWALSADSAELPLAAATARVSATAAFHIASKENIQTHGGVGFTWAFDCHLFYRRSKQLALRLGGAPFWKNRLVDLLETRNAA